MKTGENCNEADINGLVVVRFGGIRSRFCYMHQAAMGAAALIALQSRWGAFIVATVLQEIGSALAVVDAPKRYDIVASGGTIYDDGGRG